MNMYTGTNRCVTSPGRYTVTAIRSSIRIETTGTARRRFLERAGIECVFPWVESSLSVCTHSLMQALVFIVKCRLKRAPTEEGPRRAGGLISGRQSQYCLCDLAVRFFQRCHSSFPCRVGLLLHQKDVLLGEFLLLLLDLLHFAHHLEDAVPLCVDL